MEYFVGVALLILGMAGVLGWYNAVKGWRASDAAEKLIAANAAELQAAVQKVFVAEAGRTSAEVRCASAEANVRQLQAALDGERASRQTLIDALAKSGAPVAPVVVDSVLDELYPPSAGRPPGPGAGGGGGVQGVPAVASGPATKTRPG